MTISRRLFTLSSIGALGVAAALRGSPSVEHANASQEAVTAPGTLKWRFPTEVNVTSVNEVGGTLYAFGGAYGDGTVYSIDAESGAQRWRAEVPVRDVEHPQPPILLDGTIFFGGKGNIIALDADSGSERWRLPASGRVHSAVDGIVYINGDDDYAYSVDASTGGERWRSGELEYFSSVINGTAYVESYNLEVYAVDTATGSEKWRYSNNESPLSGTIVVDDSVFILNSEGIDALDANNGHQRWRVAIESGYSTPIVASRTLLLPINEEHGRTLSALDTSTGSERWNFFVDAQSTDELTAANEFVYFGAYHGDMTTTLYALDVNTGVERWSLYAESGEPEWLRVIDGTLYVNFEAASHLVALNAESGSERWQFGTDDSISSPACVSNGTLYFGCEDLNVYAIVAEPAHYPSVDIDSAAVTLVETPVRAAPLSTGNVVTTLPADTEVFVSGESKESGGVTWWPVITPDGTEGWIDGSMLRGKP